MANLGINDRQFIDDSNIAAPTYFYDVDLLTSETNTQGFRLGGDNAIGVICPATFEPTEFTVEVSLDGITWITLNTVTVTVAAGTATAIAVSELLGWMFVRFVANAAPVADRVFQLYAKRI